MTIITTTTDIIAAGADPLLQQHYAGLTAREAARAGYIMPWAEPCLRESIAAGATDTLRLMRALQADCQDGLHRSPYGHYQIGALARLAGLPPSSEASVDEVTLLALAAALGIRTDWSETLRRTSHGSQDQRNWSHEVRQLAIRHVVDDVAGRLSISPRWL